MIRKYRTPLVLLILVIFITSCHEQAFQHNVKSDAKPWKHTKFDNNKGKFSFAVFSDLTGGERQGVFETAIAQMNLLRPEFIVNVGDLIEGGESDTAEWHKQWNGFDKRASKSFAPIFYMGGNHDLSGQIARNVWKERYGPRYYHFVYKDVLFLILDTEDYSHERIEEMEILRNEAMEVYKREGWDGFGKTPYAKMPERKSGMIANEQKNYILRAILDNSHVKWTFVLIHKPVWENTEDENFKRIEKILAKRPYTVFYGHTHVYKYEERLGRDYINLSTTGGVQFPKKGPSYDHLLWVTVDNDNVSIANLKMRGILDKTGHIPLNGDSICFEKQVD